MHGLRLALGAGPILIGLVVLAGWLLNLPMLKSVLPGLTTMKANTAVGLLAGGAGTLLMPRAYSTAEGAGSRLWLARLAGAIALCLGVASLAEYVFGVPLGVDELFFSDPHTTSPPYPGRMSPATAASLACAGLAILLLCGAVANRRHNHLLAGRLARAAHLLSALPASVAYLSVTGYVYHVDGLYNFGAFAAVALHTALGFAMLAPAILLTQSSLGWGYALAGHRAAHEVFRRLLPPSLLFPFLAGFAVVCGARARIYDPLFGPALFALASAAAAIGMAWAGARLVSGAEARLEDTNARLAASELALRVVNEGLEARVREEVAAREAALVLLAHSQRMEALGQLAGGIAHDFNNVMQAIQGGAGLIRRRTNDPRAIEEIARMVEISVERGISVTRRLLSFARRDELRAQRVDPAALLDELREVLVHGFGSLIDIRVQTPASGAVLCLEADKGQLETVLINVAANGRDAMPGGGTLTLSASEEWVGDGPDEGHFVRLEITDTGEGMTPAVLVRASEPFFTTKAPGQGTGLGLAMARSFAEQSSGRMAIASALGEGTTVTLWFPACRPELAELAPFAATAGVGSNHVTVLVVDDEDLLREVLSTNLTDLGYTVLQASGAGPALLLLNTDVPVGIMLTDYAMPGMNGLALIKEARVLRPDLPAILLTGHGMLGPANEASGISLLRKPVKVEEIAGRISALLEPGGAERRRLA